MQHRLRLARSQRMPKVYCSPLSCAHTVQQACYAAAPPIAALRIVAGLLPVLSRCRLSTNVQRKFQSR